MSVLPEPGKVLDSLDMRLATLGLADQVRAAMLFADDADDLPALEAIENVLVLGMGGSGIGGDILAAVAGPFMPVPVTVKKGYGCPSFAGEGTLCFAISFSGNTEETIEAATEAAAAGASMVVMARGGELEKLATSWDAPFIRLPSDIPMPRAGIGAVAIPPLRVLERIGLFPGGSGWIERAVDQLERRRDEELSGKGPAAEIARRIGLTMPLVYGGGDLGAVAALRWKNQINENAKVPCFWHTLPELCHNEVCGWGQHGDMTRQVLTLVELRHDDEHPQIDRRFALVREATEEVVGDVIEVRAEGDGALAQLFDLVLIGDLVSLHLAAQLGVDPGPIPILDDFKRRLAE